MATSFYQQVINLTSCQTLLETELRVVKSKETVKLKKLIDAVKLCRNALQIQVIIGIFSVIFHFPNAPKKCMNFFFFFFFLKRTVEALPIHM